jgi:uncharacterized membrane protein YphA (DoxX/SURF4 family)
VIARALVGAVFLAAGALKAAEPVQAILAVGAYDVVPAPLALGIGFLLPGVEIAVGAALLTGFLARGAAALAALMSLVFLFVVGWANVRGLDIACGCFGALSPALESGYVTATIDVALLGGSLVGLRRR